MLPALYDDQRSMLARLALMMCGASVAIVPFLTSESPSASAAAGIAPVVLSTVALPSSTGDAAIHVDRDPFVSELASQAPAIGVPNVGADAMDLVLPPNGGADGLPAGATGGVVDVRAVVLGKQSRALVDTGGNVRVLGIGDAVAGSTIVGIDAQGVILANGERIGLTDMPK